MKQPPKLDRQIAEYRRNFYNVYHNTIAPIFKEQEKKRKKLLVNACCKTLGLVLLGFIVGHDFWMRVLNNDDSYFVVCEFFGAALFFILAPDFLIRAYSKFQADLKKSCMSKLLPLFGNISWVDEKLIIFEDTLKGSEVFGQFNLTEPKDGFIGEYKGVQFKISELELLRQARRGNIGVFKGVVINFKFNKGVKAHTIITTRGDNNIKGKLHIPILATMLIIWGATIMHMLLAGEFNLIILMIGSLLTVFAIIFSLLLKLIPNKKGTIAYNLREIKLEDPEFTKSYKAYSTDQVEGRYLITPAFMERFKNMQTAFGTNRVKCSFYGDSLMFAISTGKNLFEIGNLFRSLNNPKQLETFFNEITSIFMLIDYFKLDEETGI